MERLVALERSGVIKLYVVDGDGPTEVGSLNVGLIDERTAAMVSAALSDLRSIIEAGQLPAPLHAPRPLAWNEPAQRTLYSSQREASARQGVAALVNGGGIRAVPAPPRKAAKASTARQAPRKRAPAIPGLGVKVVAYVVEHGPIEAVKVAAGLGFPTKRVSNALGSAARTTGSVKYNAGTGQWDAVRL